jgi:23S rRNA pseudouridine2605 synthase
MSRRNRPEQEIESGDAKIETSERLQKVLAAAGLGSRRDCEELITQGRVEIDRQVASELGTKVDPLRHEIRVDGVVLHRPKRLYFAVNKPPGVVTTNFDPSGRPRVIDLVPTEERVFAVGRLDRASEGLILVTNDGELANRVTHPRYGVEKTYHVRVEGAPDNEQLLRLRRGVRIAEGLARVQSVRVKSRHKNVSDLEILLNEGKNREIRRILAKVGHKVLSLKRVAVGPVKLGELKSGTCRKLMPQEIESLIEASRQRRKDSKKKGGRSSAPSDTKGRRQAPPPLPAPAPVAGSAPPKIDLATLLNPALAPKHAVPVTPVPQVSRPSVGDVISYETPDADASVTPLQARPKKRRRPLREYETDSEPIELGAANEPPPIPVPMRTPRPGRTSRPRDAEPRKGAAPGVRTPRSRFRSQPRSMAKYAKTDAPRGERGSSGAPRKGRSNKGLAKPGARRGPGKHRGPAAAKGPQRGPGKFRKRRGK